MNTNKRANNQTATPTPIRLINPSLRLIGTGHVVESKYIPTCGIVGCSCTNHDSGYRYVDMLFSNGLTVEDLYIKPETPARYERSYLATEYEAMRRAPGLPKNAPEWAFTPESRHLRGNFCYGRGVDVYTTESGLKVVTLMVGCNDNGAEAGYWKEKSVFATSDGFDDNTKQFLRERSRDDEDEFFARRRAEDFSKDEATRMYVIPKKDHFPWQLPILVESASKMRATSVGDLCKLIKAETRQEQSTVLNQIGVTEYIGIDLPHPQVRDFAEKALWIFHGVNFCDVESKPLMPDDPAPFDQDAVEPAEPKKIPLVPRRKEKPKLGNSSETTPAGAVNPKSKEGWSPSMGSVSGMFALGALMTELIARKP